MKNKDKYNWLGNRVQVLPIEPGETVSIDLKNAKGESMGTTTLQATEGGILLPENVAQQEFSKAYLKGIVMAIGDEVNKCKVGDTVLVQGGRIDGDIKYDNTQYYIFRQEQIAAVEVDPTPVAKKEKPKDKPSNLILN